MEVITEPQQPPAKSKRGRKPKQQDPSLDPPEDKKEPTKRSRKNKVIANVYDSRVNEITSNSDDEHVIVKLNIPSIAPDSPKAYNKTKDFHFPIEEAGVIEVEEKKEVEEDSHSNKVVDLLKDFEEKNKNNEWPQTTSICCYWCCHKFQTTPFGLPIKYSYDKFHVIGCFCSLECTLAYNYDSKETIDEKWERANLINYLAKRIGIENLPKPAPPRLSLKMFGGHLSIDDFRDFCKSSKIININFPPMLTQRQQIEEINECDVQDFKYIPVDQERINKFKDKLVLRRTKPVNLSENTLENTMNLRFGKIHKDTTQN